jgi:hypothetical protein
MNIRDESLTKVDLSDTLLIVSADFSHFMPLQKAVELENKAAHALMYKQHTKSAYINIVDHIKSFKALHKIIPSDWFLQWIGRTRSIGDTQNGVGYLSFFIKTPSAFTLPDGMFVTCYDIKMNARECLGEWFDTNEWTQTIETRLIRKVVRLGTSTSRLTGSRNTDIPVTHYTVTYLYKDTRKMIRGYHGIRYNAFYLPEVLLEHTFPTGRWITSADTAWEDGQFRIKETLTKLTEKGGSVEVTGTERQLYRSEVRHVTI